MNRLGPLPGCLAVLLGVMGVAGGMPVGAQEPVAVTGHTRPAAVPPRLDVQDVLPDVDLGLVPDLGQARRLQAAVRDARDESADALLRERIACYRRILVYRCLADIDARERAIRARLDRIEVIANQAIREGQAIERNQREAEALADRAARLEADAQQRAANTRQFEARQAASRAQTSAPDLPAAGPALPLQ